MYGRRIHDRGVPRRRPREDTKYGKIFFPTWDSRIKFRDWSRADWDKICPETSSYIYKTEGVDSAKDVVVDSKVEENKREDAGEAQYLSIFPNPSSGTFTVRLTNFEHSADFEIRIEDMQGRVVYSAARTTPSSGETLSLLWDANETNTGIYLCHVKVGNKIFKDKMVKF